MSFWHSFSRAVEAIRASILNKEKQECQLRRGISHIQKIGCPLSSSWVKDSMMILALLSFLVTGMYLALGVYILRSSRSALLNQLFFLICLSLAVWSFACTFLPSAETKDQAWFWFRLSAFGWTLSPALILHFCLRMARRGELLKRQSSPWVLYVPGLCFLLLAIGGELGVIDFVQTRFGWSQVYGDLGLGVAAFLGYLLTYVLFGLWQVFWSGRRSGRTIERRQAQIVSFSGVLILAAIVVSGIVLPWLGIRNPPNVAHLIAPIWVLVIWDAIYRYQLMVMTPARVAPIILKTMDEAVILLGHDSKIITVNRAAQSLFADRYSELEGRTLAELVEPREPSESKEPGEIVHLHQDGSELVYVRPDSEEVTLQVFCTEIEDDYSEKMGEVVVLRDVTSEKRAKADLRYLATHDPLTDLPNRSLLNDRLERAVRRAEREAGRFAMILFDLDEFKQINDEMGHDVGDAVLTKTARRLSHCVRGVDTICRLGGDEFLVVLEDLQDSEEVDIVARRIQSGFAEPVHMQGRSLSISGSMGVSTYPSDGLEVKTLMRKADLALKSAKGRGRGAFQFFSEDLEAKNRQKMEIEKGLNHSLANGELFLVYQPLLDSWTGEVASIEALLRWSSPDLGLMGPLSFIPIAERSGLIVQIGEWVLKTACQQNYEWQQHGLPPVPISVNISARQLQEDDFVTSVLAILKQTSLEPQLLELELTETTAMANLERSQEQLTELADYGVRIVIDDFGTGYSSLARLRQLPIDAIKVDKSFIDHIADDETDRSLVMAIVAMARNLGLQVIAEGVETFDQLEALQSMEAQPLPVVRCDRVQGYLFSRPIEGQKLPAMFMRSKSSEEPYNSIRQLLKGSSISPFPSKSHGRAG